MPTYSRSGSIGCTATYCHGQFKNGQTGKTVVWAQDTTLTCNSCHGTAGPNPATAPGGSHPANATCATCHLGYTGTTVVAATHINGLLEVSTDCTGCHTGTQGTRRAIVPEFALAWSHKKSAAGQAVTKFDCAVCHMEGDPTTGNTTAAHQGTPGGNINLRDPDLGTEITNVAYTAAGGASAGSYAPAAGSPAFTQFSRNLGSATLEPAVQAIMINQCLKCHDANGANSALARVPGGTAGKPFNTTKVGAGYLGSTGNTACATGTDGCVTNVNASFATTNSSYHPVLGQQNNWYSKLTRMVAPWNAATRGVTVNITSWGPRLSCWDCHALPADTGTITRTVTAHGGASTLRGTATATGNPPVVGGAVTLCNKCHAMYNTCGSAADACATNTSHGAQSAFSSDTGRSEKEGFLRYGCNKCHSSSYTTAVLRPIRAQDSHGFDRLPGTGTDAMWPTGATETRKPFAFIRNTQMFSNHQPARVGATTYTPTCVHLSDGVCNSRTETYSAGGTF